MDIKKLLGEKYREDMTVEEQLAALEELEEPAPPSPPDNSDAVKWKAQFDKTASELADLKKKHKAALSDEQLKEAERAEKEAAMQAELETLRKASEVTTMKAKYLALGYDEKLAESTAQAFSDGDTDTVFANQKAHIESVEKAAASKALDDTHKPRGGSGRQPDANSLVPDKNMTVQQTIDKKAAFLAEPQA